MPERKRIVRFEIVFSCIPFLLRLSQIVEPEPEPHPRPSRICLKINHGFRTFYLPAVSPTNPDFSCSAHAEGVIPVSFLKMRLKYRESSYPTVDAAVLILISGCLSRISFARAIRRSVRYWRGDVPYSLLYRMRRARGRDGSGTLWDLDHDG